jgi:hypothetical protein
LRETFRNSSILLPPAGHARFRAISLQTASPLFIPGVLGAVVVDLQAVLVYPVNLLDPSGASTSTVTLPSDPGLAGLEFIEQGAQVLPIGIALSPPIVFTII